MGWKGTLKSINAANNRAIKASERRQRQQQKEAEKIQKKLNKIEESKEKVLSAPKNDYAAGKISDDQYKSLKERMNDISDELIMFGKTPAVTLGKKYLCGKIDKEQFDAVRTELVPKALDQEKNDILSVVSKKQENVKSFKKACKHTKENICQKCGQPKKLLKPLRKVDEILLCNSCSREYKNITHYEGFDGVYLTAEPCEISDDIVLSVGIKQEWL